MGHQRQRHPTPVESESSKPYRIFADPYGDPKSHAHRPVTDAMCPVLVCVAPTVTLAAVGQILERQRLPGVPVLGPGHHLLGMVTWRELFAASPTLTAGEVMHHAMALPSWTPLSKAAAIMSWENIDLATVVDAERRVVGLLSALDLVRWLAREDGYVIAPRT